MRKAFTLVEVIIVVSILGILAAIVLPTVHGQTAISRNVAAKDMLKTLRNQIELYKFHHRDQAPGFINGYATSPTNTLMQFTNCTKENGSISPLTKKAGDYIYGPYLPVMASNPFNKLKTITIVPEATDFSAAADGTSSGWLYKAETADVRINSKETDKNGIKHYEL